MDKDRLQHELRVSNRNRWSPFILVIFCFICYLLSLTFSASNWQTFSSIILMSTLGWNILEIKTDLKVWFCFSSTLTLPPCLKTRGFCLSSVNPNLRDYEGDRTERDEPVCGKTFAPFVFIFFPEWSGSFPLNTMGGCNPSHIWATVPHQPAGRKSHQTSWAVGSTHKPVWPWAGLQALMDTHTHTYRQ